MTNLFGEGYGRYNIYVKNGFYIKTIHDYLAENKRFLIAEQRKHVPQNLSIYCMSLHHKKILENAGFEVEKISDHPTFFRVRLKEEN